GSIVFASYCKRWEKKAGRILSTAIWKNSSKQTLCTGKAIIRADAGRLYRERRLFAGSDNNAASRGPRALQLENVNRRLTEPRCGNGTIFLLFSLYDKGEFLSPYESNQSAHCARPTPIFGQYWCGRPSDAEHGGERSRVGQSTTTLP